MSQALWRRQRGERPLGEKVPDGFDVRDRDGQPWKQIGGMELHRLVLEDFDQLERRADEINRENVNSRCSFRDGYYEEVSQTPLPNSSPGDATVPGLQLQSLGLGAPAAEQGRRSKQGRKKAKWNSAHPPVLGGCEQLDCSVQEPPGKGGDTSYG